MSFDDGYHLTYESEQSTGRREPRRNRGCRCAPLSRKGLDGVGVAEITRDAGLTHGGLYRHFESRMRSHARPACAHSSGRSRRWTDWSLQRQMALLQPDSEHWCMAIFLRPTAITLERAARLRHWLQMPQERGPKCRRFCAGVERNIQRFMSVLQVTTRPSALRLS